MMYFVNGVLPENLDKTDKMLMDMVRNTAEKIETLASGDYEELAEYFEDVCDVKITIGGDFRYRGVVIQLAFGGPNIYFDTATGKVEGYWGFGNSFYDRVSDSAIDAVDDYYEDYYETCR